MPAQRPRATFEPIPPDFDVREVVENTENFEFVTSISVEEIQKQGIDQFEKLVLVYVVGGGRPLVIEGFDQILDPWTFTPGWLDSNCGKKVENARDITKQEDIPLTISHYLSNMPRLTNQYFERRDNYKDKSRQRVYLKDIDCPKVWQEKLKEYIPGGVFYLNETIGEVGGPGAVDEGTSAKGRKKGRGIARAGDLMSSLPEEMRAENLMCYIGHEGTYTPAHKEMCASLGQNIMVNASGTVGEDGKPERPGSSIWFMTETKDRHTVAEYWLSVLGHDIEVEKHFAQVAAWKRAPFKTYIHEQKPGDFILIPPLAPHQVWNRGTRTMKVAWNRTTVETLEMAFDEALPNARMVCRDEQYKNKAIVYYTLLKYSALLKQAKTQSEANPQQFEELHRSTKVKQVKRDFKRLLQLYKNILLSEMFSPDLPREHPEFMPFESFVTCAYCRGNIFNRFLTCKSCVHGLGTEIEEPYDICMDCYVMGRSCYCISDLKWVEQWRWKDLLFKYEEWRQQVLEIENGRLTETTPLPLSEERRSLQKKTLAQICQEQLRTRPWVDPNGPNPKDDEDKSDEEITVNDDGTVRKTAKKKSKAYLAKTASCHVCLNRHPKWKMAKCTTCDLWFCYGALFRAHDLMPQTVMENPRWQCPHCQKVCNTGACRRDPRQRPYEPKGTLLGHDTKKVADARSTEALVDFSVSNLNWIRDEDEARLERRRAEADLDKLNQDQRLADEHEELEEPTQVVYANDDESFLDPALRSGPSASQALPGPSQMLDDARANGIESPPFMSQGDGDCDTLNVPQSVQYQDEYMGMNGYADAEDDGFPDLPRKRHHDGDDPIKLTAKRQKTSKGDKKAKQPVNDATKQYLKQMEKKRLEQARKEGRFIHLLGRMKGRQQIVTLRLPSERLQEFKQKELEERRRQRSRPAGAGENGASDVAILQSDVADKRKQPTTTTATKLKNSNKARIALEDDDDYDSRRRSKSGKKKTRYEEIDIGSGDEEEEEDDDDYYAPRQRNRRARVRGDDELVELPDNWRDGTRRRRTVGEHPTTNGAQVRPPGTKPARASTGNMSINMSSDDGQDSEAENGEASELPKTAPMAPVAPMFRPQAQAKPVENKETEAQRVRRLAEAAMREQELKKQAEENLRAKMQAAGITEDSEVESSLSPEATRTAPPPSHKVSIMDRLNGKKVKIVSGPTSKSTTSKNSAASSPAPAPRTETPSSGFTPVNKPASMLKTTVQYPDTESEDYGEDIPARPAQPAATNGSSESDGVDDDGEDIPARPKSSPAAKSSARGGRGGARGQGRGLGRGRGRGRGGASRVKNAA
ncbi:hypothetical protein IWZ03DRAFT_51303 [Phyllosticta citriasiana]|uniref:JmjC domain-containing protein n=1 Tax=Phyllosticta citriasiana TaxID=595635 RepID=A0ABR1KC76_9PEZI